MYLTSTINTPKVPGKIVIRKKGNCSYVLYEIERVYDSKRQFNVPKRVIVGKIVPDTDDALMIPNERFSEFFPDRTLEPLAVAPLRSSTLRVGSFIAFSKIIKEYELRGLLEQVFRDQTGLLLDLVLYMIVTEDNAGQYYPEYARYHPLFTNEMKILGDSSVSRFLQNVSRDQITTFMDLWNARLDHRQRIYVSYDSTNKNSQAGAIDLMEFGKAKVDEGVPVLNLALAFDKTNQIPLFYELYPGSVNDVSQLKQMVDKIVAYNYRSLGIIIDRGYFSRTNLEYMDSLGINFLIMIKGCRKQICEVVEQTRGTFETKNSCRLPGTGISGTTVKRMLYADDGKVRYFHLFFDSMKMASEREELETMIENMTQELKDADGCEKEWGQLYTKFFNLHFDETAPKPSHLLFAEAKDDVIERELQLCGYFCLVSSEKMTAEQAYRLYRGRDISEKLFRADKSFLDSGSQRVHSRNSLETKIFIEFVALIIRNRFYNLLKEELRRLNVRKNYMTVPAALKELEKIEMTRVNGGKYLLEYALTRNQKQIFQALGLSQEDVLTYTQKIAAELKLAKDKPAEAEKDGDDSAQTENSCIN